MSSCRLKLIDEIKKLYDKYLKHDITKYDFADQTIQKLEFLKILEYDIDGDFVHLGIADSGFSNAINKYRDFIIQHPHTKIKCIFIKQLIWLVVHMTKDSIISDNRKQTPLNIKKNQ